MSDNTQRFVDVFGYTLAESPRLSKHVQKMKNDRELCDWLCKSMGLATRGVMRGTPRGATRGATQGAMRVVMNKVWREQPK